MTYRYLDGANNEYQISPTQICYVPIQPKYSSSGHYDGGTAYQYALTPLQYEEILTLLEAAILEANEQVKQMRNKGMALLIDMTQPSSKDWTVLPRNFESKKAIEAWLASNHPSQNK